jgi:hypothetical protein
MHFVASEPSETGRGDLEAVKRLALAIFQPAAAGMGFRRSLVRIQSPPTLETTALRRTSAESCFLVWRQGFAIGPHALG